MNLLTLDHIIVYAFLAITLAVGLYYGRGVKTLKDFAIANNKYPPVIITITLIATMIGAGAVVGDLIETIGSNFLYIFSLLGLILGIILLSLYFAPKFDERFKNCISIGDVLEKFLGKAEAKTACFIMLLECVGILGAQLIVMGHLCTSFLGLSYEMSIFLTSGIIIFYSTFGGIRSVTMTDVLQFFIIVIAMPLLVGTLFKNTQVSTNVIDVNFQSMFSNKTKVIDYFALAIFYTIPLHLLKAPVVQRYLMIKSIETKLSRITLSFALAQLLILLMLLITAICVFKLQPLENLSEVMSMILQNHLSIGVRGLAFAGIIAVIMSTADSFLNASSILFVKNVLPQALIKDDQKTLLLTKITTLIVGISASFMALQNFGVVTLLICSATLLIAGAGIPLAAGLFGLKVNRQSFWICLFTAGITYSISKYIFPEFKYIHSLFTLITSVSAFFISHYIINGGFAFDPNMKVVKPSKPTRKIVFQIPAFRSIEKAILRKIAKRSASLTLFPAFCYITLLHCLFLFAILREGEFIHIETLFMVSLSAFFCTLLLLKDMWSIEHQKKYLARAWLFCLCYCIPFVSTMLLIDVSDATYPIMLSTIGFFILSSLVDRFLLAIISVVGIVLGCLFEFVVFGGLNINIPEHTITAFVAGLVIALIVRRIRPAKYAEKEKSE